MINVKIIAVSVMLVFLSACRNTVQYLVIPTNNTIEENIARIELNRISGFVGSAALINIKDDDVLVGKLANGGKLVYDRPAGKVCISAEYREKLCFFAIGGKLTRINFEALVGLSLEDKSIALDFKESLKILKEQEEFIPIKIKY